MEKTRLLTWKASRALFCSGDRTGSFRGKVASKTRTQKAFQECVENIPGSRKHSQGNGNFGNLPPESMVFSRCISLLKVTGSS